MAKIKQTKMRLELDPEHGYKETIVNIYYDTPRGYRDTSKERFYVPLPPVVADSLGMKETRGNTQEEAFKRFEEAIEKFKNLKTERHRVILYQIDIQPNPEEMRKYQHYFSSRGYRAEVWAGTYEETVCIDGSGGRRYSYEPIESSLKYPGDPDHSGQERGQRREHQVPWTDQNEAFFIWIADRMQELVTKMDEIKNPGKLLEVISAGRLLPLGSASIEKT